MSAKPLQADSRIVQTLREGLQWVGASDAAAVPTTECPANSESGTKKMHKHRQIIICGIAIAIAAAIGIYTYRDLVVEIVGRILAGIMMIPVLSVLKEAWEVFIASWPIRKLREGVCQIARMFDRIPGAVYVIVLALGICDSLEWLPYGLRDAAAWLPERQRRVDTPADPNKAKPNIKNENIVQSTPPPTSTPAPPPSKVRIAPTSPVPTISPLPTKPQTASDKKRSVQRIVPSSAPTVRRPAPHVDVDSETPVPPPDSAPRQRASAASGFISDLRSSETHVLEFHVPAHGNDPLHVTVHADVQAGAIVAATLHGRPILLQVRRPLTNSPGSGGVPRWLAVPIDQGGAMVVATP